MALRLNERYPGRTDPASIDYPQGSFKNRSSPTAKDGTYLEKDWANDDQGFKQSLLSAAGVTANGQVDKVGASQYFDALKTVIRSESPTPSQATESVAGIAKVATLTESDAGISDQVFITPKKTRPYLSGNATLTGSSNNIALSGIVASIGLEKGDVIRVIAGSYNKLHSVESVTDANNIVVNYEHCGTRGNGSLKLPDYTGSVTITRIVKWFSAPKDLGRDWVNVASFRSLGAAYVNNTGRGVSANICLRNTSTETAIVCSAVVGVTSIPFEGGGSGASGAFKSANASIDVCDGKSLTVTVSTSGGGSIVGWSELR